MLSENIIIKQFNAKYNFENNKTIFDAINQDICEVISQTLEQNENCFDLFFCECNEANSKYFNFTYIYLILILVSYVTKLKNDFSQDLSSVATNI